MADQDTIVPPGDPGQEPIAPAVPSQEPPAVEPTPAPEVPLEDKILQKFQSWQGRRDAQMRSEIVTEIMGQITQAAPKLFTPAAPVEPEDLTTRLLNDPRGTLTSIMEENRRSVEQKGQDYVKNLASIMDSDADLRDNQEVGMAIIEKLKTIPYDPALPSNVAADLAFNKAKSMVYGEKIRTRTNPLAGNQPITAPVGTATPPATTTAIKPKANVDEDVRSFGKRIGLTDEQIEEEFLKG